LTGRLNSVIGSALRNLPMTPFDPRLSAPLADKPGVRKSRVGGWRILFTVDREAKVIYILTVDTRGQVYKHS
jgi:mRNA interferase RelE/StbE